MLLLFAGMLEEFFLDGIGVEPACHEIMALVAQHADKLRRQRLVQHLDHLLAVGLVGAGDGALLDMLARAVADFLDVGGKGLHGAGLSNKWQIQQRLRPPLTADGVFDIHGWEMPIGGIGSPPGVSLLPPCRRNTRARPVAEAGWLAAPDRRREIA